MMKRFIYICLIFSTMIQTSCKNEPNTETVLLSEDSCNVEINNVKFLKSINVTDDVVSLSKDTITINAKEKTDLFCDPKGIATNTTAPVLITTVDNTKPFTFTVKVTPGFTKEGTYSAGGIMAFVDKSHWQKLCYEQDEAGNYGVVTVRTVEVSDDNNHDKINLSSVYLRMSSDTKVIGNFYSEDGINWHLVRVYKNEYPEQLNMSISAQSPKDKGHLCKFSDIELVYKSVRNFREGEL